MRDFWRFVWRFCAWLAFAASWSVAGAVLGFYAPDETSKTYGFVVAGLALGLAIDAHLKIRERQVTEATLRDLSREIALLRQVEERRAA